MNWSQTMGKLVRLWWRFAKTITCPTRARAIAVLFHRPLKDSLKRLREVRSDRFGAKFAAAPAATPAKMREEARREADKFPAGVHSKQRAELPEPGAELSSAGGGGPPNIVTAWACVLLSPHGQ